MAFKLDAINALQFLPLIHSNNSYLIKIECNRYSIQTLQREIILGICCKIDTRCKNTHHVFIVLLQVCCKILIQSTQNKIQMCKVFTIFWSSFCYYICKYICIGLFTCLQRSMSDACVVMSSHRKMPLKLRLCNLENIPQLLWWLYMKLNELIQNVTKYNWAILNVKCQYYPQNIFH